jgi:acyl-coenzyme A thioesterase PaaI-like protein
LGVVPAGVLVSCADNSGSANVFTVTEGTHDATNVKVTVTTSAKYKILAWL